MKPLSKKTLSNEGKKQFERKYKCIGFVVYSRRMYVCMYRFP